MNVRGAGRLYNGSWYVTRVHHTLGPGGYKQRFEAQRNAVTRPAPSSTLEVPV